MSEHHRSQSTALPPLQLQVVDELREREARFRALAEHARDAILEITPDARVLYTLLERLQEVLKR